MALPEASTDRRARLLLSTHRQQWVRWRCDLLTDWVRAPARHRRDGLRYRAKVRVSFKYQGGK